jgi:hypothetical protein
MTGITRSARWLVVLGNVALLSGLWWDAQMHRLDPDLAMREGVFTLGNPGHALFIGGVALIVIGTIFLLLDQMVRRPGNSLTRRAIAMLAATTLVGLSVVTFTAAVSGQDGGHHEHGGTAGGATAEQRAAAAKLLADVKAGIARHASLGEARADGYIQTTPFRFLIWGPAHFSNYAYNSDGRVLDPERPETLVYMKLPRGEMVLLGAMFVARKGEGPRPGGPLTEWHAHDNLCITSAGTVALAMGPGQCPPGAFFVGEAVEMLHVWIFDNPDGPFAHMLSPQAIQAATRQFSGGR